MNHVASRRPGSKTNSMPQRRDDVDALIALVSLDQSMARREATVASSLTLVERTTADLAACEPEISMARDDLQRLEGSGAETAEVRKLRRLLRDKERGVAHLMRLAEEEQAAALAASTELREQCADLATRRTAITNRIPRATLEDYESALGHGLVPAAVATRGQVCWGCFHRLSAAVTSEFQQAEAFVCCPHCERVLFNPDWIEGR
jgi:predicted  nucleic acid-binding Zn-ribbon protein